MKPQDLVKLKTEHTTAEVAQHTELMKKLVEAQAAEKYWKEKVASYKATLQELSDNAEVLLVNGEPTFTYLRTSRLNLTQFRTQEPSLFDAYSHKVEKTELDEEFVRKARPDLYERFAVRQFKQVQ